MRTSISRLPSKRWRARYQASNGRWVPAPTTFVKKGEAKAWLAEITTDAAKGRRLVDPAGGKMTFSAWGEHYWKTQPQLARTTKDLQYGLYRNHLLAYWADVRLCDITIELVQLWAAELAASCSVVDGRPLASQTRAHIYWLMHKMVLAAVERRYLGASPFPTRTPLAKVTKTKPIRVLDVAEVRRLADACGPTGHALIFVAAYGGLRIGELAALRLDDLNFTLNTIRVDEGVTDVNGVLEYGPPKTRASHRTVGMPRSVMAMLREHLQEHNPAAGARDFVFTGPKGTPLRPQNWRRRYFRPAVKDAGLDPLTPHDLRHTAATSWIDAGATMLAVARRLGHSSTAMVERVYGHLYPAADELLVQRLDLRINQAATPAPITPLPLADIASA